MKKLFLIVSILVLSFAASVSAQETDTTSAQTMDPQAAIAYNNGIAHMKAAAYDKAVASFDSSLQIAKDYRTYYLKGEALLKQGNLQDAAQSYQASIDLNGDYDMAYYGLANTNLALKNYDAAVENYQKFIDKTKNEALKNNAEGSMELAKNNKAIDFYNKGNELAKAEKYQEALGEYNKALEISKDFKTYYQMGLTYQKMKKDAEAEAAFKQSSEANPNFDMAYVALGNIQTARKDYDAAFQLYQKAISVSENENLKNSLKEAMARNSLAAGDNAMKAKKYDQAIEIYQKAADATGLDLAYLGLARASIEKKQYDKALGALDSASANKRQVTEGGLNYYRGQVYKAQGNKAKAIEAFRASTSDPKYKKAAESEIAHLNAPPKKK